MTNPVPKIVLHSNQSYELTGARDKEILRSLSGKKTPKILYIPSKLNARRQGFDETKGYYEKIGFPDVQLFEPENATLNEREIRLRATDVIHLSGGEVIPFAERLHSTGCDQLIKKFSNSGGVIVGVSAGAMILGSSLKTASLFHERGNFFGLHLFEFEIIPHAKDIFPRPDLIKDFACKNSLEIYAMNDGDVIILHGKKLRSHGTIQYFNGKRATDSALTPVG